MNITAKQVREQIIAQKAIEKDQLINTFSAQVESAISDAAKKNCDFVVIMASESNPIPQVVVDKIRANGFTVVRNPSIVFEDVLVYTVAW